MLIFEANKVPRELGFERHEVQGPHSEGIVVLPSCQHTRAVLVGG